MVALAAAALLCLAALSGEARADLRLCNRTSYVLDLAIGLEQSGTAATRGWFRADPGQCRVVLQGAVEAGQLYVHARALAAYGRSPIPLTGHADLCIADGNFVIAGARSCVARNGQRLVPFTAINPAMSDQGLTATIAEEADYTDEQARLAGVQRLLVLSGYDAKPIDGIEGKKTDTALAQFLRERNLGPDAAAAPGFFDVLVEALKASQGTGFSWCNDTALTVMAALGVEDQDGLVTRGWYRVEPGKCVKPRLAAKPQRLYSFGEAVDGDGQPVKRGERPLAWGGPRVLCTRNGRFELSEHGDCPAQGLISTGFATVESPADTIVRFREP